MCGIFGYAATNKNDAFEVIHRGLKRLEYRGYDSWGISVLEKNNIKTYKTTQELSKNPEKPLLKANMGVGHTRWATHGGVTDYNAHPHYSSEKSFVLAQNGIVENFAELKKFLKDEGFEFKTETDTEVIVKLIEHYQKSTPKFKNAVIKAFKKLKGRNTIIILTSGNTIMAIKNGSPLTVGLKNGQIFISSDTLSFSNYTNKAVVLDNNEVVILDNKGLSYMDLDTQKVIHKKILELDFEHQNINREGFKHFMLKEIMEQPNAVTAATNYNLKELKPALKMIKGATKIYTVGAGTASFAAGQVAYYLRKISNINAVALKSYEVSEYEKVFDKKSVLLVFSQSGETADTLEAVELAQKNGAKIISLVNMMGSTISRRSDLEYYLRVGPEICVVSTKAFVGKIAWGYLLANALARNYTKTKKELKIISKKYQKMLDKKFLSKIENLAEKLLNKERVFVLGRGQNYYIAQEGALKIKEASYKHAEAFSASELKHGVIALIEKGVPVICAVSEDNQKRKMMNAASEIKARKGTIIGIAKENNEVFDHFVKTSDLNGLDALTNIIPFQLLAYYMSVKQGFNPDKPRNLAKSVTVS